MEGSIVRKVVECVRLYEEEVGVLFPIVQALKEAFKPESVVWHWSEGEMYIYIYKRKRDRLLSTVFHKQITSRLLQK